ncbi:twin-arginine translocation pathway signal sequence domain protein [Marssonina coronariae]|uniref:Twin-arginine translocation pathway signal sequence domain protein n=1 Tax=Diplocarpon coronariae TaxID=2795749 RepID=A0A218ZFP2_9HELO|nr:twin-arginine translocation pathway signal sequence domain protein [Marssonina coronariae]
MHISVAALLVALRLVVAAPRQQSTVGINAHKENFDSHVPQMPKAFHLSGKAHEGSSETLITVAVTTNGNHEDSMGREIAVSAPIETKREQIPGWIYFDGQRMQARIHGNTFWNIKGELGEDFPQGEFLFDPLIFSLNHPNDFEGDFTGEIGRGEINLKWEKTGATITGRSPVGDFKVNGKTRIDWSPSSKTHSLFKHTTNSNVTDILRPWLFGHKSPNLSGRSIIIMGGEKGIAVVRWLTSTALDAFALVHRFPTTKTGVQAPVDDARRSLRLIQDSGLAAKGLAVLDLSSGGHLAAAVLAANPASWNYPNASETTPKPDFEIIGYRSVSTNATGRTINEDKAPLAPLEKQKLYNSVQPDVQLVSPAPPSLILYPGNDSIVPIVHAYELCKGVSKAGRAVELHKFSNAPHGFGIDNIDLPVSNWTLLCEKWLKQNGLLTV